MAKLIFLLVVGDGCGQTSLSPKSGTIATRNYPGTYPNQTQCVWNLKVPAGFMLHLIFGDFDLEWSKDCRTGSLTITDKSKTTNMGKKFSIYEKDLFDFISSDITAFKEDLICLILDNLGLVDGFYKTCI